MNWYRRECTACARSAAQLHPARTESKNIHPPLLIEWGKNHEVFWWTGRGENAGNAHGARHDCIPQEQKVRINPSTEIEWGNNNELLQWTGSGKNAGNAHGARRACSPQKQKVITESLTSRGTSCVYFRVWQRNCTGAWLTIRTDFRVSSGRTMCGAYGVRWTIRLTELSVLHSDNEKRRLTRD